MRRQGRNVWVRRDIDPADRRHILATLTPAGQQGADCILAIKTTTEEGLLGPAGPAAIERMSEDLRHVLLAIEGPATDEHRYEQCAAHQAETP